MKGPIEWLFDIRAKVVEIAANISTQTGSQGTGADYNPPTGGTGQTGYLSGIYKHIKGVVLTRRAVYDTTGAFTFDPDSCSEVITYNGDNTIATDTYTDPVTTYQFRQTYTYTGGLLTSVSGWVKL